MTKLVYLCCLIVVFSSCSIEKRLYTKGWSISWNKEMGSRPSNQIQSEAKRSMEQRLITDVESPAVEASQVSLKKDEVLSYEETVVSEVEVDTVSIVQNDSEQGDRIMYIPPSFEPFGVAAMSVFGLSAVSFTIVTISALTPLLLLSFLAALAAIVLGIISLRRWKNTRSGVYKAKWMTYVGLFGGILGVAFYALTFILLAIAFG